VTRADQEVVSAALEFLRRGIDVVDLELDPRLR
jgi:hypothetical protein